MLSEAKHLLLLSPERRHIVIGYNVLYDLLKVVFWSCPEIRKPNCHPSTKRNQGINQRHIGIHPGVKYA